MSAATGAFPGLEVLAISAVTIAAALQTKSHGTHAGGILTVVQILVATAITGLIQVIPCCMGGGYEP